MIIAIVGPTGVGKTKLSVKLAKKYNAIIINCDAMQVYKKMDIGTAKIKENEKEGIPHYLFDIKDVTDNYTVYDYQKDARNLITKYKNRNIIFVGGTGLYLKAALYSYEFTEDTTLYAQWGTNSYKVTYDYETNGGSSADKTSDMVAYGSEIDLTVEAEKEEYDFIGWSTNKDSKEGLDTLIMEEEDITL